MAEYNGHPSKAAWNVALWLGNDEGLYELARECFRQNKSIGRAARAFMLNVGAEKTPDGYRYSASNVEHAIRGLEFSRD